MLSPWLHRSKTLPVFWRCSCRTAERHYYARHLWFRIYALPQSRLTASSNMRRLLIPAVPGKMASPGGSVHALQQKRTGRRQILSSPMGDLVSWSYLRPVLTQDIFTFHCIAAGAAVQSSSRFLVNCGNERAQYTLRRLAPPSHSSSLKCSALNHGFSIAESRGLA